jgi:hypothetical protein
MSKKSQRTLIIFFSVVLLILIVIGIFFSRAPVLIVSDHYFNDLYGKNRTLFAEIRSSINLFRPVRTVIVAEDIAADGIAFAVSEASDNPFCVYFPYRYVDGARNYQEQFPSIKTILHAGRENASRLQEQFSIIQTDTNIDLYRAGFSAARIAQGNEGKILCYIRNRGNTEERNSFEAGLKDGGREGDALFIDLNRNYSDDEDVSCIVLTGTSQDTFITDEVIPIILFSWADPDYFSPQVNVIFNDSPWESVASAVKMLGNEKITIELPSSIQVSAKADVSYKEKNQIKKLNKMIISADTLENNEEF